MQRQFSFIWLKLKIFVLLKILQYLNINENYSWSFEHLNILNVSIILEVLIKNERVMGPKTVIWSEMSGRFKVRKSWKFHRVSKMLCKHVVFQHEHKEIWFLNPKILNFGSSSTQQRFSIKHFHKIFELHSRILPYTELILHG